MKPIVLALVLVLGISRWSQLPQISPEDCQDEQVPVNLHVLTDTQLKGRITDASGAPFKHSKVEVRQCVSKGQQRAFKSTQTDENGLFELGSVPKDEYRLLASPTRAFQQSKTLECSTKSCYLEIVLQASGTDLPYAQCPVR